MAEFKVSRSSRDQLMKPTSAQTSSLQLLITLLWDP